MLSIIIAIPARLESSRCSNKVLAGIGTKPMLQWVLERSAQSTQAGSIVLCTDTSILADIATEWGFTPLLTSPSCSSGSDRIASVVSQLIAMGNSSPEQTIIINVQGDQPFIDPAVIDAMAVEFAKRTPTPEVLTLVYRLAPEKVHNPNVVKTLLAADGRALYFSRSAIPHVRDVDPADWPAHTTY